MNEIEMMRDAVRNILRDRGCIIEEEGWVNQQRNCYFKTVKEFFVCKYSDELRIAGVWAPGLGKGPGITFNLQTYFQLQHLKPKFIFGTPQWDGFKYQDFDEFTRLSDAIMQPSNNEWVKIILTKSLKEFR
jgi:hypothetical protein